MSEIHNLLVRILDKMGEMTSVLEEISGKLDGVNGVYGLDDVVAKLGEVADDIVGPVRYNLTDLHGDLGSIETELSSLTATVMLKD